MPIAAFRTPPRPRRLRNSGLFDNERSRGSFEQGRKISEMINPDGSVTVRRKILNPDGSSSICQEEYSSLDRRILGKSNGVNYEVPSGDELPSLGRSTSSDSSSSASTIKTSPSRAAYLSSDRYRFTPEMEGRMERTAESRTKPVPVDLQRNNTIPIDERGIRWQLDGATPTNLALRMELSRPVPSIQSHPDDSDSQPNRGDDESSVSSIPLFDDTHNFNVSGVKELRRPVNPVPFEKKKCTSPLPDSSFISVSTWGVPDADFSAISGDSMGYPMLDISTAFHENSEKSDDETEWSLLQDEEDGKQLTVSVGKESTREVRGKPPLPNRRGTSKRSPTNRMIQGGGQNGEISDSSPIDVQKSSKHQTDGTTTSTSSVLDTSKTPDSSAQSDLVVMKQASVLAKPKSKVKYYADPGITSTTVGEERRDLRDKGALFDAAAMIAHDESSETISVPPNEEIVFTVRKGSRDDKIGIFVGVRELADGPRLVVSKVSPTGKLAESPIAKGDTVVSINGRNFLSYPSSEEALGKRKKCRRL
jgi:hypothetical protein